ncbi:MAG: DNA polymerase IV, partial [Candidatus Zixiibacteriota bacterium]
QFLFVQGDFKQYAYISSQLMKILTGYTPLVEPISVDEAFLDITGSLRLHDTALKLCSQMKESVKRNLQLTCSIGVAPNKILAKMATEINKPDGLTFLDKSEFSRLFSTRPVSFLWGIGEKTSLSVNKAGYHTVSDLAQADLSQLISRFGKFGPWLKALARGDDNSPVHSLDDLPEEKSISHETTFPVDSLDREYLQRALLSLCSRVARRLRKSSFLARTISVKVRSGSFETITRDRTLPGPASDYRVIYETSLELLPGGYGIEIPVRLLGVKATNLVDENTLSQLNLFSANSTGGKSRERDELFSAIDAIKDRYGEEALDLGSLAPDPEK